METLGYQVVSVGQRYNLAVHVESKKTGSSDDHLSSKKYIMNFSYIGLLFLVIFIHLTTITSVAAGKRSFGNKNSPAGLLLFAQVLQLSHI